MRMFDNHSTTKSQKGAAEMFESKSIGILLAWVTLVACLLLSTGAAKADQAEYVFSSGGAIDADLSPNTTAGGHPFAYDTNFEINTVPLGVFGNVPAENLRDVSVELPPGAIGNAEAMPKCSQENMNEFGNCPQASQVGFAHLGLIFFGREDTTSPVYNLEAPPGMPAQFGIVIQSSITHINFSVRTESDYGVTATISRINTGAMLASSEVAIWGVPGDPSHDAERVGTPPKETLPRVPLLDNPSECTSNSKTTINANTWQKPTTSLKTEPTAPGMSGCNQLDFSPTIDARPSTNIADSPAGLEFHLNIPQNQNPDALAEATMKEARVTLPPSLTVNPSSANGLSACSPAQIGMKTPVGQVDAHFTNDPNTCPPAAKLGAVQVDTPLLDHPLKGDIYLATQNQNPFGSLLAMYLVVEDADSGITFKLPGKIELNPANGQLTTVFVNNPQLPFEDLRLNFFEGAGAPLKTGVACGSFTTNSRLTPWTTPQGADATPSSSFEITRGAGDSQCAGSEGAAPKQVSFSAGTLEPTAGIYSPFQLRLARQDGTQALTGIDTTLPKGLIAKLAGVPYCSDAALATAASKSGRDEQANPSCPSASRVGSVNVGAGAGPTPFYAQGDAYLAGPYKGAPLSLAVITPAVAGPFDLGDVVVRNALYVDPESTQVRAVSDPLPTILQGIPLDLRSIVVNLDRASFTRNPTNCNPLDVTGSAATLPGQSTSLLDRFQVGDCGALKFGPKLSLTLKGGTKRSDHPALKAVLTARAGESNLADAAVTLPRSEFLENAHIRTVCTRVQFNADACPAKSIYGKARAFTPLLDKPLEGPVYMRSSDNKLPDLVADLRGQIRVVLVGRIDSQNRGLRNTFESIPDAPFSKFVLEMQGGNKGLLVNNRNLCKSANLATVQFDGQSGKTADSRPVVGNSCKKAKGGKRRPVR